MLNEIKSHYKIEGDSEFARFLGISPQTLHNWKKRKTFDIQIVYTKCLNISAEWLITGDGEMFNNNASSNISANITVASDDIIKYNEDYWRGRYDQLKEDYDRLLGQLDVTKSSAS